MSSRFSRRSFTPKPPPICKPPPPPPEWPGPSFDETPWQGYVDFWAPFSPYEGGITGPVTMTPTNPTHEWTGRLVGQPNSIHLKMTWDTTGRTVDFVLTAWSGGIPYDVFQLPDVEPRTWSPFCSGLLQPDPPPPGGHLRFQIWQ